jgi:bifunctional UDP-N-acetylglucosamine pyrophosphorylase / glucosamine-1-phosphate N-acetyltransferase
MTLPLSVVVMAAGLGKRMQSALPKVLHPLAGKPMLAHVLSAAKALKAEKLVVVVGHGADEVKAAFAGGDVEFALQMPQHGTGHAVMQAAPLVQKQGTVLVLNGDVPLVSVAALKQLLAKSEDGALVLLTHEMDDARSYGRIVRNGAGEIQCIVEFKDASSEQRAIREWYTGTMAIPANRLDDWLSRVKNTNAQGEYYLTDLVSIAVADNVPVRSVAAQHEWEVQGINSKQELAALERAHQQVVANALLDQGVTLLDPARIDVRGELSCGKDVVIDVNCIFEGKVTLGDRVKVGANCILRNASIGADTTIEAFSYIDDANVGTNAKIGPYARLRPGAKLADDVHIGNFVEVKASEFGKGSKANHLSYIGDTSVGSNVNIGAGTITCNYDGVNKHRTVIEDDVQIGSDVQLVAPVTVAKGTTIAAGTTVWQDTTAGELVLNPKSQVVKQGWKRPAKIAKKP